MTALIGALRVSLSADTADFEAGMRRAQSQANTASAGISKAMGSLKGAVTGFLAGLTVGFFTDLIKQGLEYASSLEDVSRTLGVTTKDLQGLRFAAGQTGVSQDQLETGLRKLTITLGQVAVGAEAPRKALNAIGITADQLRGKDTGEAFRIIADALSQVTDRSQRAAVEVALFGRAGSQLDNLLSGGSKQIDGLSAAAEKLGVVLSNDEIRNAHETAIKLEALKTVLSANISKEVADNAGAILALANALMVLVGSLGQAIQGWKIMGAEFDAFATTAGKDLDMSLSDIRAGKLANPFAAANAAGAAARKGAAGKPDVPDLRPSGGADIGQFLAPKAAKPKEDHTAEKLLRDQYDWAQKMSRAQQDTLQAQQDLSHDYIERTNIGIAILNKEQEAYAAELAFNVALYGLTKGKEGYSQVQAQQLKLEYDRKDHLERMKLLDDEEEQRQKDIEQLAQHDFDRRANILKSQEQLATTAEQRRKIELELLEIAYDEKREALQHTIDTSKNGTDIEDARRDLLNLNHTYANDRQGVLNQTRGPLEEWAATVPKDAATINEALQSIEAQGLGGLIDQIKVTDLSWKNLGDTFENVGKDMLNMLFQLGLKMLFLRGLQAAFPSAFGSANGLGQSAFPVINGVDPLAPLPGFAGGGSFTIGGLQGVDRNILSLNDVAIANVSHGERIDIGSANGGGGVVVNQTIAPNFAGNAATHDDLVRMGIITKNATIQAIQEQRRRA